MLLHDMGEGLADYRPDFEASGREWRTPPLWGIGLTQIVGGHTHFYMMDELEIYLKLSCGMVVRLRRVRINLKHFPNQKEMQSLNF